MIELYFIVNFLGLSHSYVKPFPSCNSFDVNKIITLMNKGLKTKKKKQQFFTQSQFCLKQ